MAARDFPVVLDAYDWDFCQIQYNYANERYQAGTAGLMEASRRGLAVFVMEPLLGGRLAGKLPGEARDMFDAAAHDVLRSPAAWGLAWVWNHPEVTMLLSGMTSPAMVDENADIAEVARPGILTEDDLEVLQRVRSVFERANRVPCTGCEYCMPCPQGVNIPGCFAAYNASFAHSWFTGLSQYMTASAMRTPEPKLASSCVSCGACARHCPQQIDIPARLDDARRRLTPGLIGAALKLASRIRRC